MKARIITALLFFLFIPLGADESYRWKDLYEQALETNPSLAGKREASAAAEYQWKSARRTRGPALYFEGDLSYLTSPQEVDLAAGSLYSGDTIPPGIIFPALPETDVSLPLSGHEWYSFRLVLEQPLLTSGKLAGQEALQRALWETSLLDREWEELTVQAEIITIFYSLFYLQESLDLIGQQRRTADRLVSLMRDAYDSGLTSYSDYMETQGRAREINLKENQIRQRQNQAMLHLQYLSGIKNLAPASLSREDLPPIKEEAGPAALLEEAQTSSPVLGILNKQIEIASRNLTLTRGNSYGRPDLGLRVELDYAAGSLPFTSDEWGLQRANITGTLGIRTLLGDAGRAYADVKAAASKETEARHRYRDQWEQISRSVEEELFNQNLNRETIAYYRQRADDDYSVAQQRKQAWEAGYGMEQDYLRQLITWYSDQIYEKQERISLAVSYFKMRTLTGRIAD